MKAYTVNNDRFEILSNTLYFEITTPYVCHFLNMYTEVSYTFNIRHINRSNKIQIILNLN